MTWPYLAPDDVTVGEAQKVLDFLNQAQTAQEIANRVEFPHELDVGLRVGQRILDRRAQLGTFTDIQQVRDVPYVGPERFTEIVLAITGRRPLTVDPSTEVAGLRDEVDALRRTVAELGGTGRGFTVELRTLGQRPYLGQAVTVVAEARRGASGAPVADVPITLITTWGRLRALDGYQAGRGTTVTARTNHQGRVRASLVPPTSEYLSVEQQNALEQTLAKLDSGAATPRDAEAGLAELARKYRARANVRLRGAVDIYFREFGGADLERTNDRDPLAAWATVDATLIAHLREGTGAVSGTAVEASAALTLWYRNWLGAWMEVYHELVRSDADLTGSLVELLGRGRDPAYLLSAAYGRIERFVTSQWGLVGEHFARRVAERSVRSFIETGIGELPEESRVLMRQGLKAAYDTIGTATGVRALSGLAQTQSVARRETQVATKTQGIDLAQLSTQVAELGAEVGRIDAGVTKIGADISRLDADVTRLDSDVNRIDADITRIDTNVNRIDAEVARIDNDVGVIQTRLDQTFPGLATVDQLAALETRVDESAEQLSLFETRTDRSLQALDAQVAAKVDARTFESFQGKVTTDLDRFGLDIEDLKGRIG